MKKYRKKPMVIEAIQYDGKNFRDIFKWVHEGYPPESNSRILQSHGMVLIIKTLEGDMIASINDWIVKGIKDEIYPVKPEIFEQTYEEV